MTKEISIQIACNLLLEELSDIYIFRHYHVANEGKRSVQYQMKLKKMGFKAGVPDFVIFHFPVPSSMAQNGLSTPRWC